MRRTRAYLPKIPRCLRAACAGALLVVAALLPSGTVEALPSTQDRSSGAPPIDHIIVIFLENRSFDHLYGLFPGAEGITNAGAAATQVDENGVPYQTLPPPRGANLRLLGDDPRLAAVPNGPFDVGQLQPIDQPTVDPTNRFYQEQQEIDGGKMDKFAAVSTAGGLVMGYYDGSVLPLWSYAQQFTLADHFFHAAFGGSFLNHFWLVCGCTPTWPSAPSQLVAQLAPDGTLLEDGSVSPDGYLINNLSDAAMAQLPLQTAPHIGDRLDADGVSWAWYTGGWSAGLAPATLVPLEFFADTARGAPGAAAHLADEIDFIAALQNGSLPSVAFVKPLPNAHPITGVLSGDQLAAALVDAVQRSPYWNSSAIIVTYDESGGFWDHVAPPVVDRWGPGTRIPAIIISPYAKRGFIDHTVYDTTSILRFIEWRWNLPPLGARDANVNNLLNAFDFNQ